MKRYYLLCSHVLLFSTLFQFNIIKAMCPDPNFQSAVVTQVEEISSLLDVISTKLPTLDSGVDVLDSLTDALLEQICTTESVVDVFANSQLTLQSKVEIVEIEVTAIESKIDTITIETQSIESKIDISESFIDVFDLSIQTIESKVDSAQNQEITIESKVDVINSLIDIATDKVCTAQSQIDVVEINSITILSCLTTIESKIDRIDSEIDTTQTSLNILQNSTLTVESKIDLIDPSVNMALQKACTIESKVEIIDSTADILALTISSVDILATDRQVDFQETWTVLAAIEDKICTIENKEISILNKLDNVGSFDFSGVFTAIEAIEMKACTLDSKVDALSSKADAVFCDLDFGPTFTAIEAVEHAIETACSQIDILNTNISNITDPQGSAISTPVKAGDYNETFSITTAGRYFFSENITFSGNTGTNAIYIAVDDVHIDMCSRLLIQAGTNSDVVGFSVASGLCNISIDNGVISNFKGGGIVLNGSNDFIRLTNLMLIEIGKSADDASTQESDALSIGANSKNIIFENITIQETQNKGVDLTTNSKLFIRSCQFNNTVSGDGGFFANGITQACLEKCLANTNGVTGFKIRGGTNNNIVFSGCKALGNTEDGFRLFDIADSLITNCITESNVDGIEFTSDLSPTATNNTRNIVVDSSFSNNTGIGVNLDICFNCYIADNTIGSNTSESIFEDDSNGPNSLLGNFGFKSSGANYNTSNTFVNAFTVSQTAAFSPSTGPVRWHNLNTGS